MSNPTHVLPNIGDYDLAVEAHSLLRGAENTEIPGVSQAVKTYEEATVTTICILNEEGAQQMGRPQGTYITMEIPPSEAAFPVVNELSITLASQLKPLLPQANAAIPFLIVGLGNQYATPDALGPQTVAFIQPTRHFFLHVPEAVSPGLQSVCAIAPGVMGMTGLETGDVLRGIVEKIHPCCVIVIDALAAASIQRIGTTIQISDTGIRPGSGLENQRQAINLQSMGCPVIAIGVPTVVHTMAIIAESFAFLAEQNPKVSQKSRDNTLVLLQEKLLALFGGDLVVTPKEVDQLISQTAKIIAGGITQAIHPGATPQNYSRYMQ